MDMGADLTAKDKKGISALHYACGQGRLEVVKFLWSKGLDLDPDDPGAAPWHSLNTIYVIAGSTKMFLLIQINMQHEFGRFRSQRFPLTSVILE